MLFSQRTSFSRQTMCGAMVFKPKQRCSPHPGTRSRHAAANMSANTDSMVDMSYRANVGVCIVNSQGLVFAAQRCDDSQNTWQMPQGGIDDGEEPSVAALREVTEETSIASARIVGEIDQWLTYDFPTKVRQRLHGGWQRFKGQRQKWYLAHFYGDDSEINLDTDHKEFKQWRWMTLADLPGSVVEFKREVYAEVAKEFVPLIKKLKDVGQLDRSQR